jgi:general stress protein YciG
MKKLYGLSKKPMRYHRVMFEPAEAHFRRNMQELAKRGGAATKRGAGADPGYYSAIGRAGGLASAKARRDKNAAVLSEETSAQRLAQSSEAFAIDEPEDCIAGSEPAPPDVPVDFGINVERLAEKLAEALADVDRLK